MNVPYRMSAWMLAVAFAALLSFKPQPANAKYIFSHISYPGAYLTSARGINDHGDIVGNFNSSPGQGTQGYVYRNGTFTALGQFIEIWDINNAGQLIGRGTGKASLLYDDGVIKEILPPGASSAIAYGLNDFGHVVGAAYLDSGSTQAFMFDGTTYVDLGLGAGSVAFDIANDGTVVGSKGYSGFVIRAGKLETYDYPGATAGTQFTDVDVNGSVLGYGSFSGLRDDGFLLSDGQYQTIKYPRSIQTQLWGRNASGTIVGLDFGRGFVATVCDQPCEVPEPSLLGLLGLGFAALGLSRSR